MGFKPMHDLRHATVNLCSINRSKGGHDINHMRVTGIQTQDRRNISTCMLMILIKKNFFVTWCPFIKSPLQTILINDFLNSLTFEIVCSLIVLYF